MNSTTSIAESGDGTVQFTFTIPWADIQKRREEAATKLGQKIEIAGFRKGKAPLDELLKNLPKENLVQKTLEGLLPKLFTKALDEHQISPAALPRFEIVTSEENKDWQVRAVFAKLPKIDLSDYQNVVKKALTPTKIWTPDKGKEDSDDKKNKTREEKEQIALRALVDSINFEVPALLVENELNSRLSSLLARLEKLGLNLESYLQSMSKTAEELRTEYKKQAKETLKLELILSAIARKDKVSITEKEVEEFIKAADQATGKKSKGSISADQKSLVSSFLVKRKIIDRLTALA